MSIKNNNGYDSFIDEKEPMALEGKELDKVFEKITPNNKVVDNYDKETQSIMDNLVKDTEKSVYEDVKEAKLKNMSVDNLLELLDYMEGSLIEVVNEIEEYGVTSERVNKINKYKEELKRIKEAIKSSNEISGKQK